MGVGVLGVEVEVEVLLWKRKLWRLRAPFLSAFVSVELFRSLSLSLADWFAGLEWAELVGEVYGNLHAAAAPQASVSTSNCVAAPQRTTATAKSHAHAHAQRTTATLPRESAHKCSEGHRHQWHLSGRRRWCL